MTAQNINQFAQTPVDGQIDLSFSGNVVSARVAHTQAVALIAGQAVSGDTTTPGSNSDGVPPVISLAGVSTPCIGFVARNIKDQSFAADARLELAMDGTVMWKTANAAIARFAPVEYDTATNTVIAWAGVNPICGYAYDAALAQNDMIRIIVRSPQLSSANTSQVVKTINQVVTLAQINAGLTLIPGIAGKKITVTNATWRVVGNFASGTNVKLQSTNGAPVVVQTEVEAGLTTGAIILPSDANMTLGAGWAHPLGSGDGLAVANTGAAQTAGTSIEFTLSYTQG